MRANDPGVKLTDTEAKPIIREFWASYRDPAAGKGGPTWTRFKSATRVSPELLQSEKLSQHARLYVLFEHKRILMSAAPSQVRQYITQRGPGDYADMYIFPAGMKWCIAYTAEDDSRGDVVLLAGSTEAFGPEAQRYALPPED